MAQEKVSMRKIRGILRLRYDLGLRQDQIARSCNIGQSTVHHYWSGSPPRGYELLWFEDPIAFRLTYERDFRAKWDAGEIPSVVIVWNGPSNERKSLPFDVEARARPLRFSLAELFPRIDPSIVGELDRNYLDRLYAAAMHATPTYRSERETKDYILKHVFRIVPEIIQSGPDLIRVLLRRHAEDQRIPNVLERYLLQVLETGKNFRERPLREIVTSRQAFFDFLQTQWKVFLVDEPGLLVPSAHSDVRPAIRDLFAEGLLHPERWQAMCPNLGSHSAYSATRMLKLARASIACASSSRTNCPDVTIHIRIG